jgi:ATP/maltotriose-dependent transcriptional regulator MalT
LGPSERSARESHSEFLGWQALLSAVVGETDRAQKLVAETRDAGRGLEAEALALLADAIIALGQKRSDDATAYVGQVIEAGVCDPVVIAVRAEQKLGAFLAAQQEWRQWFQRLLVASRDSTLARSFGLSVPREARGTRTLSPRETEVHELLAQGMTNDEIAKLLYISLSTTKVHVKHIYEKLGVRSRLEAARALRGDV